MSRCNSIFSPPVSRVFDDCEEEEEEGDVQKPVVTLTKQKARSRVLWMRDEIKELDTEDSPFGNTAQ